MRLFIYLFTNFSCLTMSLKLSRTPNQREKNWNFHRSFLTFLLLMAFVVYGKALARVDPSSCQLLLFAKCNYKCLPPTLTSGITLKRPCEKM